MIKSFTMKLAGTRKERSWVAYAGTDKRIVIQSDDAIAEIYPDDTGKAFVSRCSAGCYFVHLLSAKTCKYPDGTYNMAKICQPVSGDHFGNGIYQL